MEIGGGLSTSGRFTIHALRTTAIEVKFEERIEFLISFHAEEIKRSHNRSFVGAAVMVAALLYFLLIGVFEVLPVIVIFLLLAISSPYIRRDRLINKFKPLFNTYEAAMLSKQTVVLSDQGIRVECYGGATQFIPWIGVSGLHMGKSVFAFQTGVYQGVIVPLRAFPDEQAKVAFIAYANARLSIARKA